MDYVIFAFKCMEEDIYSLVYLEDCLRKTVLEILKTQDFVEGEFAGKPCCIDLKPLKED